MNGINTASRVPEQERGLLRNRHEYFPCSIPLFELHGLQPEDHQMTEIENVANYLRRRSLTLATAESCTAGLIASQLAEVPGAGGLLECAFVVYSPAAKRSCLGVSDKILRQYNLTSTEVSCAMAKGAAERCSASVIIANTGVADDGGEGVEAGTQCYAWLLRTPGIPTRIYTETRQFSGSRNEVRQMAAEYALQRIQHYHAQWLASRERGNDDD